MASYNLFHDLRLNTGLGSPWHEKLFLMSGHQEKKRKLQKDESSPALNGSDALPVENSVAAIDTSKWPLLLKVGL